MTLPPHLPAVLAIPWREYEREPNPRLKLWGLCEVYEVLVRFGAMLQLAELRALPGGESRLSDALAAVRPDIEQPTLGRWLGILAALGKSLRRTDPLVLPELPELVNSLGGLSPPGKNRTVTESLLVVRNLLAHGGSVTENLSRQLLDGADGQPGWEQRVRDVVDRLDLFVGTQLVWWDAGHAHRLTPEGTLAEALPLPADLKATLSGAELDQRVLLVQASRCLDLWPLVDYSVPVMPGWSQPAAAARVPQVYYRAETHRLLYAALGSDVPVHQSKDHFKGFQEFFRLERKREANQPETHDFAKEIESEASAVTGRGVQYDHLKETVTSATGGVLWVYGPGGIGKSYLVAKFARNFANANEFITVFWRFRAGDADRCNRHAFFRHAIRRLGDPKLGVTTTQTFPALDPSQLLKQFLDLLRDAGSKTPRKPLFILDGLDEIARSDADFVRSIFDWTIGNAVWLCAGRREGDVVPGLFAEDRCRHVFPGGLPGMTAEEIRELILARIGSSPFKQLLRHDRDDGEQVKNRLVEAIAERAAGLPLYVHFVCEDLLAGQLPLDGNLPGRLPNKLEDYFEKLLKAAEADDEDAIPAPLIAVCAWAMRPLDEDTLFDLLARRDVLDREDEMYSRDRLRGVIARLGTILRPALLTDGRVGYEPYHLTFRDHIREDRTDRRRIQNRKARDVFARMTTDWKTLPAGGSPRRYVLRHGSEHLLRERRWDDLEALARDEAFLAAQRDELPTEPAAVIRTLQHALVGAGERDSGGAMAAAVLRLADRTDRLRRASPLDVYRAGNLEGALALADLQDPQRRSVWLLVLALALRHAGDAEGVTVAMRRLTRGANLPLTDAHLRDTAVALLAALAPVIFPDFLNECLALLNTDARDRSCEELVTRMMSVDCGGRWEAALRIADRIEAAKHRAGALREIGAAQSRAGDRAGAAATFERAIHSADQIEYLSDYVPALHEFAVAQAAAGDAVGLTAVFDRASRVAGRIDHNEVGAVCGITVIQAGTGDQVGAANTLALAAASSRIAAGVLRARALCRAAVAQVVIGEAASAANNFKQAAQEAAGVQHGRLHGDALAAIGIARAQVGDIAGAFESANQLRAINRSAADVLHAVAERHARAGDGAEARTAFEQALQAAKRISEGPTSNRWLATIGAAQARAGDFDGAVRAAGLIPEPIWKADVLCTLVVERHRHSVGDVAGTAAALELALRNAEQIDSAYFQSEALGALGVALVECGGSGISDVLARLARIAQGTEGIRECRRALLEIGAAQLEFGDPAGVTTLAQALSTVEPPDYSEDYEGALRTVVQLQTAGGGAEGARRAVARAVRADSRRYFYGDIARVQLHLGDVVGALQTAELLEFEQSGIHADYKVELLCQIATKQVDDSDLASAVATLDLACRIVERVQVAWDSSLRPLAEALALVDLAQAFETAALIVDDRRKLEALRAIGGTQARTDPAGAASTFERVRDAALQLEYEHLRSEELRATAEVQARTGVATAALETAALIGDSADRSWAFRKVGRALAESGDPSGAARAFASALAAAEEIDDPNKQGEALSHLAYAQAEAGDPTSALSTAERITPGVHQVEAVGFSAQELLRAGWTGEAVAALAYGAELAAAIEKPAQAAEQLRWLGGLQAFMGEACAGATLELARRAAARIEPPVGKAKSLATVAAQLVLSGLGDPKRAFEEALKAARAIPLASDRDDALAAVAVAQTNAGAAAKEFAESVSALSNFGHHAPEIAEALVAAEAKDAFKSFLELAGGTTRDAIRVCGPLAALYPADAAAIAELLVARQPAAAYPTAPE